MEYVKPELREFGTFVALTMGAGGSVPDGAGRSNPQSGGGSADGGGLSGLVDTVSGVVGGLLNGNLLR